MSNDKRRNTVSGCVALCLCGKTEQAIRMLSEAPSMAPKVVATIRAAGGEPHADVVAFVDQLAAKMRERKPGSTQPGSTSRLRAMKQGAGGARIGVTLPPEWHAGDVAVVEYFSGGLIITKEKA